MAKIFQGIILGVFFSFFLTCGEQNDSQTDTVIVFSDIHYNPFYDPALFESLVAAEASEWAGIFETSTLSESSTWTKDTNYPLLVRTLTSIRQNLGASSLVINTGDFLGHKFSSTFYTLYGSEDEAAMQAFAYKTIAFIVALVRSYVGTVPVMFVLGNNDAYEDDYKITPDSAFLSDTADLFYTDWLNGMADPAAFFQTYQTGGYYVAEPLGPDMVVIGLNTVFLSTSAATGLDSAIEAQMTWFQSTLASARAAGKKVWLLMHIPPGVEIYSTAKLIDGEGRLTNAQMLMPSNYQTPLLQILSDYSDIITFTLAGHTHMDEYRMPSSGHPLEITPAISPRSGNNPAFKVFTFSYDTFEVMDYASLNYDLATLPEQFRSYYTFSTAYSMTGQLDATLSELILLLDTDKERQPLYRDSYYSGHEDSNSITDANWPVYWCGMKEMTEANMTDCVNSY